jgi:hypothetical protein
LSFSSTPPIKDISREHHGFFLASHNFLLAVHHYQARIPLKNGDTGEGPDLNLTGGDFPLSPVQSAAGSRGSERKAMDDVCLLYELLKLGASGK